MSPARNDRASAFTTERFGMAVCGGMPQRVSPGVSKSAFQRSAAHATNAEFFTIPWGNPREAKIGLKVQSQPAWSTPPPRKC